MAFAIKSPEAGYPLVFGDFKIDVTNLKVPTLFNIDDVASLGTDIVPLCTPNPGTPYPCPDPHYTVSLIRAEGNNKIYSYNMYFHASDGSSASVSSSVYSKSTLLNAYLMASTTTLTDNTHIYLISKNIDADGVITWRIDSNISHKFVIDALKAYGEYTPYTPPEASGGFGLADKTSDPVDFPSLPLVSALGTGTVNMYRATQTALRDFSRYLWTGDFVDNIKKLFQDPMEALISVQIVPYTPEYSDTLTNVYLSWIDTGVQMYPLTNQYVVVDCGSIAVSEYWGAALDYPPNTDVSIFLPYIGMKSLSGQDVMGRTVQLKYHIDTLSGSCVAMLKCSGRGLESVLYSWTGNCNTQIPISARDFSNVYTSAAAVSASAGVAAAKGGAALAAGVVVASALNPASFDTQTRQNGSIGSTPSYLGIQTPFLCITRPIDSTPEGFNSLLGRPSNLGGKIGDYSGYLEVTATHIEGFPATEKEKNMISSLLASGIII